LSIIKWYHDSTVKNNSWCSSFINKQIFIFSTSFTSDKFLPLWNKISNTNYQYSNITKWKFTSSINTNNKTNDILDYSLNNTRTTNGGQYHHSSSLHPSRWWYESVFFLFYSFPELVDRFVFFPHGFFFCVFFEIFFLVFCWGTMPRVFREKKKKKKKILFDRSIFIFSLSLYVQRCFFSFLYVLFAQKACLLHHRSFTFMALCVLYFAVSIFVCVCALFYQMKWQNEDNNNA
jgi:hypothetical protein